MRVFVTGGTGLVGSLLVKKLRERGDSVVILSRRSEAAQQFPDCKIVVGDPMQPGPWMDAVPDCDAVVHLAGEGIFNRRWSQAFKDLIYSSRIKSTDNIVAALGKSSSLRPGGGEGAVPCLINASASLAHMATRLGEDALRNISSMKVCDDWEKAAGATVHGVRVVFTRTGIVLDKGGGLKQC